LKNISLLPPEIKTQQRAQQQLTMTIMASAVVLAVFLCIYIGLIIYTHLERNYVQELQAQRTNEEVQAARYKQYADMKTNLDNFNNLVQKADGDRPDYSNILSALGIKIPDGVWLTDFIATCTTDSPGAAPATGSSSTVTANALTGVLTIRGSAFNHTEVANLLDNLKTVPGVTDILCQSSVLQESTDQQPTVQLEIKASLPVGKSTAVNQGGVN
jgi:Tfp pilus assembly protein PilN